MEVMDHPEGGGKVFLDKCIIQDQRFPIFNPDGSYYISGSSSYFGYALLKDGWI